MLNSVVILNTFSFDFNSINTGKKVILCFVLKARMLNRTYTMKTTSPIPPSPELLWQTLFQENENNHNYSHISMYSPLSFIIPLFILNYYYSSVLSHYMQNNNYTCLKKHKSFGPR